MKVAIISSFAPTLVNFRGPLIAEMVRQGHQVLAFAPDHDAQTRLALEQLGATPIDYAMSRTGLNPLSDAFALAQLTWLLRKHQPDLSFGYFIKPVIYGTIAAKLAGVPRRYAMMEGMGFIFTDDGKPGFRHRILQRVSTWLFRTSLSFTHRLLLLNADDCREFMERRLIQPERAAILGGIGVDLSEWPYQVPKTDPVEFVFVGRLLRDKGVEEFAAAASMIRKKHPSARFLILGGHDENPTSIPLSRIRQWVNDGLVIWPGHVPIRPALKDASVFVLPSYREGVPRSTQEAMAAGLPIITSDVPGCRDTIEEGVNGFLVPARDAAGLAKAMTYFLDHPERIVPMGQESRRMAEARFDVNRQNQKLLDLIDLSAEQVSA